MTRRASGEGGGGKLDAAESRASGDEGESETGVKRDASERRPVEVRGEFGEGQVMRRG